MREFGLKRDRECVEKGDGSGDDDCDVSFV